MCQTIGLMVYHSIIFNVTGPKFWTVILIYLVIFAPFCNSLRTNLFKQLLNINNSSSYLF
jgi:hypothetical protein